MNPDDAEPRIPITVTGPLALDRLRAVEETIRRAVGEAVLEHQRKRREISDGSGALVRGRELHVYHDIVRVGRLPSSPVLSVGNGIPHWYRAGGHLEVETDDPVRALSWGKYLFGARGFAVFTMANKPGRLLVRALTAPLETKMLGPEIPAVSRQPGHEGVAATTRSSGATLVTDADLNPLIVSTTEGFRVYRTGLANSSTAWAGENIDRWAADLTNPNQLEVSDLSVVLGLLEEADPGDLNIAHIPVTLDRSLFTELTTNDRRRYLLALIRAVNKALNGAEMEQYATAMVDLIATCPSKAEMDELLLSLVANGMLVKLFSQFDKPVFRLLLAVGSHLELAPLDSQLLLDAVFYQLKHPQDGMKIGEAAGSTFDGLRSAVNGVLDMPALPFSLAEMMPKLYELYVLLAQSMNRVPWRVESWSEHIVPRTPAEADAELQKRFAEAGTAGRKMLLGLEHIEKLTGTAGVVTAALTRSVVRVIVLELLAAYVKGLARTAVGITPVETAKAAKAAKVAKVAKTANVAEVAKVATIAKQLAAQERLLTALAKELKAGVDAITRRMALLPKAYDSDLSEMLRNAPKRSTAMRRIMAVSADAGKSGIRYLTGLRIIEAVETKLGALSQELLAGLHRLLDVVRDSARWSGDAVHALLNSMSQSAMTAVLQVAARLTDVQLHNIDPVLFSRVARATGALEFVIDTEGRALRPTARAFGSNTSRYEHFLARVAEAKKTLGPQQYQDLLQRLSSGKFAGFGDSNWLADSADAAYAAAVATTKTIRISELGTIGTATTEAGFRAELTKLARTPGSDLGLLLDKSGNLRTSRATGITKQTWFEGPELLESAHAKLPRYIIGTDKASGDIVYIAMDAFNNRNLAATVENIGGAADLLDRVVLIGGAPFYEDTARLLVNKGLIDPAALANAPRVVFGPKSRVLDAAPAAEVAGGALAAAGGRVRVGGGSLDATTVPAGGAQVRVSPGPPRPLGDIEPPPPPSGAQVRVSPGPPQPLRGAEPPPRSRFAVPADPASEELIDDLDQAGEPLSQKKMMQKEPDQK